MTIREWTQLEYLDPETILAGLRDIARTYPLDELPYEAASLRKREFRKYGEGRQCALFCYLIGKALDLNMKFALDERGDYDCIAYFEKDGVNNFVPIQMKELVPEKVNPHANLQNLINSLSKYVDSNDLTVAIHLNQAGTIRPSELTIPELHIGELWFFGANKPDQSVWTVIGNLLEPNARFYEIEHPEA